MVGKGGRDRRGRFSRSSITTTRIARMKFRTNRFRVLGAGPRHRRERQTLQGFTEIDKMKLSIDDVQMAIDVYDDCIAYLDRRLGTLLDELSRAVCWRIR